MDLSDQKPTDVVALLVRATFVWHLNKFGTFNKIQYNQYHHKTISNNFGTYAPTLELIIFISSVHTSSDV